MDVNREWVYVYPSSVQICTPTVNAIEAQECTLTTKSGKLEYGCK